MSFNYLKKSKMSRGTMLVSKVNQIQQKKKMDKQKRKERQKSKNQHIHLF